MERTIHENYEMIFLCKRRCNLMSIEEHIVFDYFFKNRLLKLTPEERTQIIKLREGLTKLIRDWDDV